MDQFWPGALTIVLPARTQTGLEWTAAAGGTIALRVPAHPLARELIGLAGPLATSSANLTGLPPALNAADAARQLGAGVAVYVDGGQAPGPEPSTIIDASGTEMRVLRRGVISAERLRDALRGVNSGGNG
jgi:tRNA threonylcarbamoyl adenosine modification protein (Sua5/YciO/YrdC/YwlC family)